MYRKILVPLDGSELAECVFSHVEIIAGATKAVVEAVRVVEPLEIPTRGGIALSAEDIKQIEMQMDREVHDYMVKIVSDLRSKGIKVESKVFHGKVAESLVDYAHNANVDLIIMATHGRSGISRWVIGSVADRILHATRVPVLLVRSTGAGEGI